jgi:hypothetical protein
MSRLKKYREEQNRNFERIKYFCLEPTLDNFKAIVRPKSVSDICFIAWRTAALYKFSVDWGIDTDLDGNELTEDAFLALDAAVSAVISAPTRTLCEQLMFIFYATGELKYIDIYYQCMGMILSPEVRKYLSTLFIETRDGYSERICKLIEHDRNHFDKYNVELSNVDFSYFRAENIQKFKEIIEDKKLAHNAHCANK